MYVYRIIFFLSDNKAVLMGQMTMILSCDALYKSHDIMSFIYFVILYN